MNQNGHPYARRDSAEIFLHEGFFERLWLAVTVAVWFQPQPITGAKLPEKVSGNLLFGVPFTKVRGEAFREELLVALKVFFEFDRYSEIHVEAPVSR
jgi:hypothetical protein